MEIRDTNNNQPQFPDCSYEPVVPENQDVGYPVVQVHSNIYTGLDKQNFSRKILDIFLPISFNICFGCSKEPSH